MPSTFFASTFLLFSLLFLSCKTQRLTGHPPEPEVTATVECYTTADATTPILIEVYGNWSPQGAARFLELVADGYYDKAPVFRVVKNFIVQFGISLDPALESKWGNNKIPDDPNLGFPFDRGYISFAGGGRNSRATQVFIAYSARGTQHLGKVPHETPFGKVVSGMEVADKFFDGDGQFSMDMKPWGLGPEQGKIKRLGANYLRQEYPKISYITKCKIVSRNSQNGNAYDDVGPTVVNEGTTRAGFDDNDQKWKRVRTAVDRRRTSSLDRILNDVQNIEKRNSLAERLKDDINPEKRRGYLDFSGEKVEKFDALELRRKLNRKPSRISRRSLFDEDEEDV